jgi:hypothetical protein
MPGHHNNDVNIPRQYDATVQGSKGVACMCLMNFIHWSHPACVKLAAMAQVQYMLLMTTYSWRQQTYTAPGPRVLM